MLKKHTIVILGLFLFSCKSEKEIKPTVQNIQEFVFASGQLEWDNSYNLTAQTDGTLQNVNFEVGDSVLKGQNIAKIENQINQINAAVAQEQLLISDKNLTDSSPALQQLQVSIQFAENKFEQDKLQADRYTNLYENQAISRVLYENMQLNAKNSLSNLNVLKKQYAQVLQQAKQQQIANKGQLRNNRVLENYNSIVVTTNGTIIKKLKSKGDYVRRGDIIATIANQQKVKAVLNVDENSIEKVKIGQLVFVKLNTNKTVVYKGIVTEILSAFDTQSQSFICKVSFEKPIANALFGTQLEANILVNEKKNALLIPRSYLGFGNKVNVKGKDEEAVVNTGIVSTDYVEVLSGIDKNTVLIPLKP